MTYISKIFQLFLLIALPTFMACEQPPTVVLDPDLTTAILGGYSGNYVVNYSADPDNNTSSQITLTVSRVDNTHIKIDAQGGDSFECTISGTTTALSFSNITDQTGVYTNADDIEGFFRSGTLYYKVTGIINGGDFYAEFTVI